jgi:hypothetical protein
MSAGTAEGLASKGPRYRWVWPLLVICVLSFSVHLWPYAISPYPFNNDSLVEGSVARDIVDTGTIQLPGSNNETTTHSESTPAWNVFLAFVASSLGADPMFIAQFVVASISIMIPLITYLFLVNLGADKRSALVGSLFIALFGTFLYLTASGWKLSFGVALYVLLVFVYTQRTSASMRFLMVLLLMLLPFVHHLVAIVAYMTLAYLTGWAWFYIIGHSKPNKVHYYDLVTIVALAGLALGYYYVVSLDRVSYIGSSHALILLLAVMLLMMLVFIAAMMKRTHSRWTYAPIPAAAILLTGYLDYNGFIFDYAPSQSPFHFYLLIAATSLIVFVGWVGLETVLESRSGFRAVPLAMLLPALTLIVFALVSPTVENKHQLIYRTFDFANPALALGVGMGIVGLGQRKALKRYVPAVIAVFLVLLLSTVPYGIYTEQFTGVRHDTQAYEIDAFEWVMSAHFNDTPYVNSDERLSYIAWTLYGLGKDNTLPRVLSENTSLIHGDYNLYQEFWATRGVNDFPAGLRKISPEFMARLMAVEDVFYVGGPIGDQIYVIRHSWVGQISNDWYYPY